MGAAVSVVEPITTCVDVTTSVEVTEVPPVPSGMVDEADAH